MIGVRRGLMKKSKQSKVSRREVKPASSAKPAYHHMTSWPEASYPYLLSYSRPYVYEAPVSNTRLQLLWARTKENDVRGVRGKRHHQLS